MLITLILVELSYPIINEDGPSVLQGAYQILDGGFESRQVFFHSKDYLIIRDIQDNFTDHKIILNEAESMIHLPFASSELSYSLDTSSRLNGLHGVLLGRSIYWKLKEINLSSIPLVNDDFELFLRSKI